MYRKALKELQTWKNSAGAKPLILKGARQIGKTHLLNLFGTSEFKQHHYFNFEENLDLMDLFSSNLNPNNLLESLNFYSEYQSINVYEDLIIFDEIQYCPRALTSLKYFYEKIPELKICTAGSLLGLGLEAASFPVGKVDFLEMFPMSFDEFLLAIGDEKSYNYLENINIKDTHIPSGIHEHIWQQLKSYLVVGGLPEVVKEFANTLKTSNLKSAFLTARTIQDRLIKAYLADIAKHSGKENSMHIERLWRNIPQQLSQTQDSSAPKYKLRGQIPNIKGFSQVAGVLDWLKKANTVIQTPIVNSAQHPLYAYSKENTFKLFMFDIGILGAVAKLDPATVISYDYGSYKGFIAENFVAQELIASYLDREVLYSWKENTAEIEFLIEINGKTVPIEVKAGNKTRAKSLSVFDKKYNPDLKVIISAKNLDFDKDNKILKLPLYLTYKLPKILEELFE